MQSQIYNTNDPKCVECHLCPECRRFLSVWSRSMSDVHHRRWFGEADDDSFLWWQLVAFLAHSGTWVQVFRGQGQCPLRVQLFLTPIWTKLLPTTPVGRFNIKRPSYQYWDSCYKDETVSYYYGNSYTCKTVSLYWIKAQGHSLPWCKDTFTNTLEIKQKSWTFKHIVTEAGLSSENGSIPLLLMPRLLVPPRHRLLKFYSIYYGEINLSLSAIWDLYLLVSASIKQDFNNLHVLSLFKYWERIEMEICFYIFSDKIGRYTANDGLNNYKIWLNGAPPFTEENNHYMYTATPLYPTHWSCQVRAPSL